MKKYGLFCIVLFALFVSCTQNKKPTINKHDMDEVGNMDNLTPKVINFPKSGKDTLKASYFADTVLYVPLETNKDNYIRMLKKIWVNDSVILINGSDALFLFKINGKYIRQIGRRGKGPGEYVNIFNFDVVRDTIYISSTGKTSFLRYTFDGKFCDEIHLNYQPVYFNTTSDGKLIAYKQNEGKLYVYKNDIHIPDTVVVEYGVTNGRYKYSWADYNFNAYFQKYTTGLLFNTYQSDTIWNLTNKGKEPAFIFNMQEKLLPLDQSVEFCNGDFERWGKRAKAYHQVHFVPYPSFMFIFQRRWTDNKYDAIYLYDYKSGGINKFNTNCIYDDIVAKQGIDYIWFLNSADYLVANATIKLKNINQNKTTGKDAPSQKWIDQMKKIQEYDNPVLVLMKIKRNL